MKHLPNLLMAVIVSAFCVTMYFLFFETPWLTYKNVPFPVELEKVRPGEVIPVRVIRCSAASAKRTYRIARSMVRLNEPGSAPVLLPDTVAVVDPGCMEVVSSLNVVPVSTAPGRYIVVGIVEIQGAFREMFVEWHSQEFEVTL